MSSPSSPSTHRRTLVRLARPVYFELLAGVAAGIINMVWVARLGGDAVAAVALAGNVENLLLGVVLMAGSGTTVLVARARGADDPGAVRSAVRGGTALCALLVPPVALGGYLLREPLAALLLGGSDHPAHALAGAYFAISLPGTAVFFATNVLDGILKGAGDTRTPMRLAFLANGLILVLDPLLIHAYGVPGAALATVTGRTVALAAGLVALRRDPLLKAARAARAALPTAASLRRTAATGLPMSVDFAVRMAGALALVSVVARLGVTEIAAYGIATKAMYVATMAFYAVRQAASIHSAHLLGAGLDERRAVGRQALVLAGVLGASAAALLFLGAGPVMRAFGAEPEVAAAGALFLRCLGPYLLLMAGYIALAGVFEGTGASPYLARITVTGVLVQLPLAYALSRLGLGGICLAMALAMAAQCAALGLLHRRTVTAPRESQRVPDRAFSRSG
ncbi:MULTISPECIES: MATE family efflux transporter [Streptomyces]|uniref:Probable multidrug resistance protein NorM n=1 Tax=Streptomyces nymphaeiformis TaxID=2663842 RepID=A0A7W7TV92_9ACTN|nr:MATE family efflux transporter [Streptomyces nymphaeiformis]MBB4979959.1 putative MATE family efflux protein [Streptomyces nymphaeiformis]